MISHRVVLIILASISILTISSCEKEINCDNELTLQLREMLQTGNLEDVRISYSWTDGFGPGDLYVTLRNQGISTVRSESILGEINEIEAKIDNESLYSLVQNITSKGFLCLKSIPRKVCIADGGKYTVTTQVGHLSKEIFADGENAVNELDIFIKIIEEIHEFDEVFEINFLRWSPYGMATISCPEEE